MAIEAEIEQNHAFVLGIEEVGRLWKILEEGIGSTSVTIRCADKTDRALSSVAELDAYENSQPRKIVRLRIFSQGEDWKTAANITFGGYEAIRGSVTANGEVAVNLRDRIDEILLGTKPWYNRLATIDFFWLAGVPLFLAYLVLQVLAATTPDRQEPISLNDAVRVVSVIVGILGLLGATFWGLYCLRKWAFPVATFAIGQGRARHEFLERVRWTILVGLLVSIAASVIVSFLL